MEALIRVKIDMVVQVRAFLRANPFGEPKADAVMARFSDRVDYVLVLVAQQRDGVTSAKAARAHRRRIRSQLSKGPLRHLARIARAAAAAGPEVAEQFKQPIPNPNDQEFRANLVSVLDLAKANRELFGEHGMNERAIGDLERMLAEYDQAMEQAFAGRRAHTSARSQLRAVTSELLRIVRQLDGMMVYRFQEHPELEASWKSARNVAWPAAGEGREPGQEASQRPDQNPEKGPSRSAAS